MARRRRGTYRARTPSNGREAHQKAAPSRLLGERASLEVPRVVPIRVESDSAKPPPRSSIRCLRDVVVMGASAGGVGARQQVLQRLPADLPASLFVVVHMPPEAPS